MTSAASGERARPFQLKRMARAASPGLHINIVDAARATRANFLLFSLS